MAPIGYFVAAYLVVWALTGLPAYLLWHLLSITLMEGDGWALRLAGATLLLAGAYQLTPLKRACLRHCRSPMSYFMRLRGIAGAARRSLPRRAPARGVLLWLLYRPDGGARHRVRDEPVVGGADRRGSVHRAQPPVGHLVRTGLGVLLVVLGAAVVLHPPFLSNLI